MKIEKASEKRYIEVDHAKGVLIFCVILGHVLQRKIGNSFLAPRIQLWIYLFHMPAFIFIAGMFSKKTVQARKYEKVFSYLLLYVFMKALFYVSGVYVNGAEKTEFMLFHENGIPWYCLSMSWWYLLVMLIRDRSPRIAMTAAVLASVIAGCLPLDASCLAVLRTINFFPFFYLGYLTDPDVFLPELRKRKTRFAGICILLIGLLAVVLYNNKNYIKLFRGAYLYSEMGKMFFGVPGTCARLLALLISLGMLLSLLSVCFFRADPFSFAGKHTLQVLVFHGPLISIMFDKTDFIKRMLFPGNSFVQAFVFSLLILFITLLPPFDFVVQRIMRIPGMIAGEFRHP